MFSSAKKSTSNQSVVLQLQALASDPTSNVEELLNKALVVARKLKIKQFRKWCEMELEGYAPEKIPNYRKFKGQLKVFNPYYGIQPFIIPSELDEVITLIEIPQPIGNIINLLNQDTETFRKQLSNDQISILIELQNTFAPLEPRVIFYRTELMSIITKIRNIILNWSLQLEEDGILGEGFMFSEKEKEAAMSVNHFNIQNMQGVVGSVSGGSTINQNNQLNIKENEFNTLAKYLMQNKVEFSDIQNLKNAIDADSIPKEPNKLGSNVSNWIASMMGKAANGSWEVGIGVAGTLLAEAISKFYGLG
ncbi:hypothetical protein [Acinetobacter modestus]|uniref:AbiTii domain-containing protein n=1 Tax=Acinetobacter modestus TaxID=1776740 RepID=UPI003209153F